MSTVYIGQATASRRGATVSLGNGGAVPRQADAGREDGGLLDRGWCCACCDASTHSMGRAAGVERQERSDVDLRGRGDLRKTAGGGARRL